MCCGPKDKRNGLLRASVPLCQSFSPISEARSDKEYFYCPLMLDSSPSQGCPIPTLN